MFWNMLVDVGKCVLYDSVVNNQVFQLVATGIELYTGNYLAETVEIYSVIIAVVLIVPK